MLLRKRIFALLFVFFFSAGGMDLAIRNSSFVISNSAAAPAAGTLPASVIVLANSADPASIALAHHYLRARNIPAQNLISLPLSEDEEISWREFVETLWNPLLRTLVERKFITGNYAPQTDPANRYRLQNAKNKTGYLVLCKGVPLRVREDKNLNTTPPPNYPIEAGTSTCSVDSELALLAVEKSETGHLVPNPLFGLTKPPPALLESVVRVARLDAPTYADCRRLVSDTLAAEQHSLAGRVYIDSGGGPTPEGNCWLQKTADIFEHYGFDITHETSTLLLDYDRRADAPAFYFGWYAKNISGRIAPADFRFLPGAIAAHLHSFSAETLRSETLGWTGPLIARGAAVSLGNVAEPFFCHTTHFPLFCAALLRGEETGAAYAVATPSWSWQTILVGDPLYTPCKLSLFQQVALVKKYPRQTTPLQTAIRDFVTIRAANLLLSKNATKEARKILAETIRQSPSTALRFALAKAAKHPALAWSADDAEAAGTDTGLLYEIARYLVLNNDYEDALPLFKTLIARQNLPPRLRAKILPEAISLATELHAFSLASEWQKILNDG